MDAIYTNDQESGKYEIASVPDPWILSHVVASGARYPLDAGRPRTGLSGVGLLIRERFWPWMEKTTTEPDMNSPGILALRTARRHGAAYYFRYPSHHYTYEGHQHQELLSDRVHS